MTVIDDPPANPTHPTSDRRKDRGSPAATPTRTLRRRVATYVRNVARDRQPIVTLSEQVLSGIHNVHSVHR
jgi:hypothetical protein